MLEQVRGLGVDLERVFLIQQVQIEPLTGHPNSVLQTTTSWASGPGCGEAVATEALVGLEARIPENELREAVEGYLHLPNASQSSKPHT